MGKRIALIVLALAALLPAAASAASPSVLTPGNTINVNTNTCVGQTNHFTITALVQDPSDANKISIASRVVVRVGGHIVRTYQFATVETNLNHNTNSLTVARSWTSTPARHARIIDTVHFIHGNSDVAAARRVSVAC